MNRALILTLATVLGSIAQVGSVGVAAAQLAVVSTTPALNQNVAPGSTVSIEFDRALDTTTIDHDSFRVFGRGSGTATGNFSFSNGNKTVTLTPADPFSAGEFVFVNLSHDIKGADTTSLRSSGYAYQFGITTVPSIGTFQQIDSFSNKTGPQTRIYGASSSDLNNDGYLDLATINEVSADVRVFLNLADGSGLYGNMLPAEPIGVEASPNEPADFNNDGFTDLCVAAATSGTVSILLGAGDGTFSSTQNISVGSAPHGIAPLDVDGDGDLDIVNANVDSGNLSLMINNGSGVFGMPTFFDGGVSGEYGLTQADMNGDGLIDLVVGGRNGSQIVTQLNHGNGTFSAAEPAQSTGGNTWVVVVGDVDGDGILDAVTANDGSGTIGVLIGNGNGTFQAVDPINIGTHVPSVDLGDLDGDGDLDMVVSSFGGHFWRRLENDGDGNFTFVEDIPAPDSPSCSILLDFDNDGDLDMALTDELADVVVLMRNGAGVGGSDCSPAPSACRKPTAAGKSTLTLTNKMGGDHDKLSWVYGKGEATTLQEFSDQLAAGGFDVCLYEDGELVQNFELPQTCSLGNCWKQTPKNLSYRNVELIPDGILSAMLSPGAAGRTRIKATGKGSRLGMPDLTQLGGVLTVQLQSKSDPLCWGASFSSPFKKNDGVILRAISDAPDPATPEPAWSDIHATVVGPICGSCHGGPGGFGGLANLSDCNTAYTNLVNVPSVRLPTMDRVEPGDPGNSWVMVKIDGLQNWYDAECVGGFCGAQMPLGGELAPATRAAIFAWIANGAENDCP